MGQEAARFPMPPDGVGLMTIAFDLDGTLAEPTWPNPRIGDPIPLALRALKWYAAKGFEVIIHTSRPAEQREHIRRWLYQQDVSHLVYSIETDKPRAAMYIDDRALRFPDGLVPQETPIIEVPAAHIEGCDWPNCRPCSCWCHQVAV